MADPFSLVEWTHASEEDRSEVTRTLGAVVVRMAHDEAERGEEPSARYGAFSAARRLLWYLSDPKNIETLPEDFKQALQLLRTE